MLEVTNGAFAPESSEYTLEPSNGYAAIFNGRVRIRGPLNGGFMWGKATTDWVANGNGPWESIVTCSICLDSAGTLVSPTQSVNVYLPRTATADPNVRIGDVIAFMLDPNGVAICVSDVLDGKIGDLKDIITGDPTDWSAGLRGWFPALGTNGTIDVSGPLIPYGWTGAGDYATVGVSVASAFTATISGSGGTVALTIASSTTGITVSNHSAHTHSNGTYDVSVSGDVDLSFDDEIVDNDGVLSTVSVVAASPTPGITQSALSAVLSVTGTSGDPSATLTHTVNDAGHGHSGSTVASNSIASTLSIGTPSTNRPAGVCVLRVQRVS
jgi:hypothetical protein